MAALSFLVLHGVNALIDDSSTHLVLDMAKLITPTEKLDEFTPAGGNGAIEVALTREPCVIGFDTKGLQPDLITKMGRGFGLRNKLTIFGALVDEYANTGAVIPVVATAYGRVSEGVVDDGSSKEAVGTKYQFKSISKYTLQIGNQEVCRFNIELGGWVDMDGQQTSIAQTLGIV